MLSVENRIQVRLKNAYEVYTTEAVTVRYLRPPHDIRFEGAPAAAMMGRPRETACAAASAEPSSERPTMRLSVAMVP